MIKHSFRFISRAARGYIAGALTTHTRIILLTLLACTFSWGAAQEASDDLLGVTWHLQEIEESSGQVIIPDDPSHYTLTFEADGRLFVQADCNRGTGRYLREGELLTTTVAYTLALCPPGSLFDDFTRNLEAAVSFGIEAGVLQIDYESGIMAFRAADDAGDADAALAEFIAVYEVRLSDEQLVLLELSQEAWETFRRASCDFEASGVMGGTAYPMALASCMADKSTQRLAELQTLARCEEGDLLCPAPGD